MNKKVFLTAVISICATLLISVPTTAVLAEQSGDTSESGVTSYIKQIYQSLVILTYGSDAAGGWGDWGAMWNRIRSAAEWTPDGTATSEDVVAGETCYSGSRNAVTGTLSLTGDATEGDVASGKTFYSDSFTRLEGSAPAPVDYSKFSLATVDDWNSTYKDEDSTWQEVAGSPFSEYGALGLVSGKVKLDTRTGLLWTASSSATNISNAFTLSADGTRPTGGNAIAFCDALNSASYGGRSNWYLPTQKELFLAYVDGIYSQDQAFGTQETFWSSTQLAGYPSNAHYSDVFYGYASDTGKSSGWAVRCVARD